MSLLSAENARRRLERMQNEPDPNLRWDEACAGSACAMVLFVGPSPGGTKQDDRPPRKIQSKPALWDEVYDAPLGWSRGFKASFQPLVENLLDAPYSAAGKLIGVANMDWIGNPRSKDVAVRYMWDGKESVIQLVRDASPKLVIAMDSKTFQVLQIALHDAGFPVLPVAHERFRVRISDNRQHRRLRAFKSEFEQEDEFVVVRSPQHPARIFNVEYAKRCGEALREAVHQIAQGQPVNVERM